MLDTNSELAAVQRSIETLSEYEPQQIERILRTVAAFFSISPPHLGNAGANRPIPTETHGTAPSVKEFMLEKHPTSNPDRMACLAYYIVHHRQVDEFKTEDLVRLNSEAAQLKFTDPIQATKDAVKAGLLISGEGGKRRISAIGETYVDALPDRRAARAVLQGATGRRKGRRRTGKPSVDGAMLDS